MWRFLGLVTAVGVWLAAGPAADAGAAEGVPAKRLAALRRGVNLCRWFRYVPPDNPRHYEEHITEADLRLIKRLGVGHVRLAVSPALLCTEADPALPVAETLNRVPRAVRKLHDAGLTVILDLHAEGNQGPADLERRLLTKPNGAGNFALLWSRLAAPFADTDPDKLLFELLNEPTFDKEPDVWPPLQDAALTAVRKVAPRHTVLVTGPHWGSVWGLTKLPKPRDGNVVATFHCYEPMAFTHQGATWTHDAYDKLKHVPYPGRGGDFTAVLKDLTDPGAKNLLDKYRGENWDADRLRRRLGEAAAWGKKHGVPLHLGEFGCYPPAPAADRLRWLRDLRQAAEGHDIAWTVWGYDEGFGLGAERQKDGTVRYDKGAAGALGLEDRK